MRFYKPAYALVVLLLLTACSSATTPAPGAADFLVTIEGALTATFEPSQSHARFTLSDDDVIRGALVFENTTEGPTTVQSLSFGFWGVEPTTGTYTIDENAGIDQAGVHVQVLDGTAGERTFNATTGTLTLDVRDGKASGSFSVSLIGGEVGTNDSSQTITVEGTFSNIDDNR